MKKKEDIWEKWSKRKKEEPSTGEAHLWLMLERNSSRRELRALGVKGRNRNYVNILIIFPVGLKCLAAESRTDNSAVLVSFLRLWSKHQAKAAEGRWGPFPLATWRDSLPWRGKHGSQARLRSESREKWTLVLRSLCPFNSVWQWCPHSGCVFPLWLKFVGHSLVDTPEVFPTWFSI